METLALEKLYPDLFEGITAKQIDDFNESWAAEWHEGWQPNRKDVAESLLVYTGKISGEEYLEMLRKEAREAAGAVEVA